MIVVVYYSEKIAEDENSEERSVPYMYETVLEEPPTQRLGDSDGLLPLPWPPPHLDVG